MVENKQILYGAVAGLISGIIGSIVLYVVLAPSFDAFIYNLMYYQLKSTGLPEENITSLLNTTLKTIKSIYWLIGIGPVINMLLIGALMGLYNSFLINRLRLAPGIASLLTGLTLILLLQLLPISLISMFYGEWFLEVLDEFIGLPVIIAPSIVYTVLLIVFNTLKGPWEKWGEAQPEIY
ncbi:MAG: hypothetical protein ABWW65_00795 [Thermoprotei archaeon]